jgi:hypothetical protein
MGLFRLDAIYQGKLCLSRCSSKDSDAQRLQSFRVSTSDLMVKPRCFIGSPYCLRTIGLAHCIADPRVVSLSSRCCRAGCCVWARAPAELSGVWPVNNATRPPAGRLATVSLVPASTATIQLPHHKSLPIAHAAQQSDSRRDQDFLALHNWVP